MLHKKLFIYILMPNNRLIKAELIKVLVKLLSKNENNIKKY